MLKNLEEKMDIIFVSFDLDSINSADMEGVSEPSVVGGITK